MRHLLPILAVSACVVKYGPEPGGGPDASPLPAEPLPPPVDFAEVEERIDLLSLEPVDVDQRDRLDAARQLLRRFREADPRDQRAIITYLRATLAIEERSRPVEAPALYGEGEATFSLGEAITEEELVVPPPPPPEPDGPLVADDLLAEAAAKVSAGDPLQALGLLEQCRGKECWQVVSPTWETTRDAFVHQEREAAGAAYLAAREEGDPVVRLEALRAVRQRLADLADRYPESPLADDVRRNVDLVQKSIEATHEAIRQRDGGGAGADSAPVAP